MASSRIDSDQHPATPASLQATSPSDEDARVDSDAALPVISHASDWHSHSIDENTLRPRSQSISSTEATVVRSRTLSDIYSDQTVKFEYDDVSLLEALVPDARDDADFHVDNNRFAFSPGQLNKMQNPKSLAAFFALGGLQGLSKGLRTDLDTGLSVDEGRLDGFVDFQQATSHLYNTPSIAKSRLQANPAPAVAVNTNGRPNFEDRIHTFSKNKLPARKSPGLLKLFWVAYNDKIIILLTVAAVISLSLGIYETVDGGTGVEWVEGVAICVAILIVTVVTSANDWQKEKQFAKLNKRNNDRDVKAIRSGKPTMISIYNVMVGDVLCLEPGDSIPADGVLISGNGIRCDESSVTGESDHIKKTNGYEVWQQVIEGRVNKKLDPFMISGSKVLESVGTYLVTSVGPFSTYGRLILSLQTSNDPTPLQVKLGHLANWIGYLGSAAAVILFLVLLFQFVADLPNHPDQSATVKSQHFVDILIVAVTVIVVAVPEGLPLAVTLALAFATTRMVKQNNLVRVLRACETMGNATVICSDKTGTLTQNKMTVVAGIWGSHQSFSRLSEGETQPSSVGMLESFQQLTAPIRDLIVKSVALNSTAFEEGTNGQKEFIGSKTEVALLQLAHDYLGMDLTLERASTETVQLFPFDSARKCMGLVYRLSNGDYRLLVKGASELMIDTCSMQIADITTSKESLHTQVLSEDDQHHILEAIDLFARGSLRTIGIVYKDYVTWPPLGARTLEDDLHSADFDDIFRDMTWVGVVGIQDPLRPEVPPAIRKCYSAGVQVKMVTGDNISTAIAIASSCGIKTEGGLVMEGHVFRNLSDTELDRVIPQLQVLARSSPEDKRILVERLKNLGETVAVTGDGTNDGPALRTADVGFSMGITGTEVAKEASSIILLDDNFRSIVTAIAWGRTVNDAVAKFLQFQITVNISAVILTFVSSIYSDSNNPVLNAVQLLWVNLIMDTFAALALATDGPTPEILDRKPVPKSAPLFTMNMWKMILGQTVYKLAVIFMLYFSGDQLLGPQLEKNDQELRSKQLSTVVFNTFVWMQIFNELNCRRLDNRFNVFEGMFRNYWFLGINTVIIGGQIMIVYIGGQAFRVTRLSGVLWVVCLICAVGCIPWGMILRMIPDHNFAFVFNAIVSGLSIVLWPFIKVFRLFGRGFKACFRPIPRFIRRVASWQFSNHGDDPSLQGPTNSQARDKEVPGSMKGRHRDAPEHHQVPPQISVPSIAITTPP
ncbi:ATPase P-type K/Mg/Cd/Cu/Zn/Na/Ca/Na/H-transporter [Penicillium crustosum]|uniref:ATPase P-type K/Mg/Cd/Cu/Zn/Na/Ca/Na/H-transporter n=1 Tax=Penicillium crustosum TaxID=36656 RepID=UPI00238816FF|nr:ATPase P-type K/Mg/Cd/Cu/Zn/Na/Ca/Na/H-transporter [Penicillium crustosum]KAJ5416973.1 ATPase P-type K/Mg/Cd/Cu/Zn/Na/Ca/Na/H-transporter [Penicillium crustosum]